MATGPGDEPLVELRNAQRHFHLKGSMPWSRRRGAIRAVDDVSFALHHKRTLSIVGESGCGKTTTARLILGLDVPTSGDVRFRGADLRSLRGERWREYRTEVQAVFQDPASALNPRRRIGSIVGEPLRVNRGLRGAALNERVDELLTAVGLDPELASSYPLALSGGMRQRVAVAQALALTPSVIVLDEPVSALDVSIRAQIMNLIKDLQAKYGVSYLLIAHDLATVRYLSHEVAAMYLGQIVERATSEDLFRTPLHPYTLALMSAVGSARAGRSSRRLVLGGDVGSPAKPPSGCRFHPRCWLRQQLGRPERCTTEAPALRSAGPAGHVVACHFFAELEDDQRRAALLAAAAARTPDDAPGPAAPTVPGQGGDAESSAVPATPALTTRTRD